MTALLHLIGPDASADNRRQLAAVWQRGEPVVCLGPPAAELAHLPVQTAGGGWRAAVPLWRWGGKAARRLAHHLAAAIATAQAVHAWSPLAAAIAVAGGANTWQHVDTNDTPQRGASAIVGAECIRQRLIGSGWDASRVVVQSPRWPAAPAAPRRGGRLIVAPAAVTNVSGHRYACWALAVLRQMDGMQDLRLVIGDRGPHTTTLRAFADSTGEGAAVEMSDQPPAALIAAADLVLICNERDGGLGELNAALAMGRPMVCVATPAARELAGGAADFVPPRSPRQLAAAMLRRLEGAARPSAG
jgi:hypothetical protein